MAKDPIELLVTEAQLTKTLYKYAANNTNQKNFIRQHKSLNKTNEFLNHGNYLAYGLAASCLWVLGIPTVLLLCMAKPAVAHWYLM